MKIKEKLKHNFWNLNKLEMVSYFISVRPGLSKKERLFFEGNFFLPGQMYKAERQALYETVLAEKPDFCFEIGTYTGGGSTFFISEALKDIDQGQLITIENNEYLYNKAIARYERFIKKNRKKIIFLQASSPTVFQEYLNKQGKRLVLLDGAENGEQTLNQYNFFQPYMKVGDIIIFHDWNTEKTSRVKPIITEDRNYNLIKELKYPESIGLAIFKKNDK